MKKQFLGLFLLSVLPVSLSAQNVVQDASIRQGKLKNGLTYYIRHNDKEAGLADFYIAQRVGSILEEPRQRGLAPRQIPTMLDYRTHVEKGSMFNTPPVVPIYSALETLRWLKAKGGVEAMDKLAKERAELLYGEIDRNKLFRGTVKEEDRSVMNICFVMNDEYAELEKPFFEFATSKGMVGIKGHRSVGGFRASCYNAQPLEGVQALVDCMKEFEAKH